MASTARLRTHQGRQPYAPFGLARHYPISTSLGVTPLPINECTHPAAHNGCCTFCARKMQARCGRAAGPDPQMFSGSEGNLMGGFEVDSWCLSQLETEQFNELQQFPFQHPLAHLSLVPTQAFIPNTIEEKFNHTLVCSSTTSCHTSTSSTTTVSPGTLVIPTLASLSKSTYRQMAGGRRKRVCKYVGCSSFVTKYGCCKKHGGADNCAILECNANVEARGVCRKHGATGVCRTLGCSIHAHARGYCRKHCLKGVCSVENCKRYAQLKGVCRKHGGRSICKTSGCTSFVLTKGMCKPHTIPPTIPPIENCIAAGCNELTGGQVLCSTHRLSPDTEGLLIPDPKSEQNCNSDLQQQGCAKKLCPAYAVFRERCAQHRPKKVCNDEEGRCPNEAVSKGRCVKHGARGRCLAPESCHAFALARGLCRKHGATISCSVKGCTITAAAQGLCAKHRDLRKLVN